MPAIQDIQHPDLVSPPPPALGPVVPWAPPKEDLPPPEEVPESPMNPTAPQPPPEEQKDGG